jgi:hypothetical protein
MLIAAELFVLIRGGIGPSCAKLHHANDKRLCFLPQHAAGSVVNKQLDVKPPTTNRKSVTEP